MNLIFYPLAYPPGPTLADPAHAVIVGIDTAQRLLTPRNLRVYRGEKVARAENSCYYTRKTCGE